MKTNLKPIMRRWVFFIPVLLFVVSGSAKAQEIDAHVTATSWHYAKDGWKESGEHNSYREFNPGLLLTYRSGVMGITGGAFRNSYGILSLAAGSRAVFEIFPWLEAHVAFGVATGYSENDAIPNTVFGAVPFISQTLAIGKRPVRVAVTNTFGAVSLGVEIDVIEYDKN
jgi:hypothetical protein